MLENIVEVALSATAAYLVVGLLVAMALHVRGLARIDAATTGTPISFRLLITPGLVVLWPALLRKWRIAHLGKTSMDALDQPFSSLTLRRSQGAIWKLVAVITPIACGAAIALRPNDPESAVASRDFNRVTPAMGRVVSSHERPFGELPIDVVFRRSDDGAQQIELSIARDLALPSLGLFWLPPEHAGGAEPGAAEPLLTHARFLRTVWGPGEQRAQLPKDFVNRGVFVLYSIAHAEVIAVARIEI
ncbi:MAG: hypothetical protein ACKVX7_17935 [Planctomycetota bacterium]